MLIFYSFFPELKVALHGNTAQKWGQTLNVTSIKQSNRKLIKHDTEKSKHSNRLGQITLRRVLAGPWSEVRAGVLCRE